MNNFKKIGLTALAGSLVAISAQAGEMSVSGSFNATYSSESGSGSQGKGLGTDKDFSVSGSGELDNGYTFSGYTLLTDAMAVSSSALSLTMGSMGTVSIASGSGGNSTKYDVQTPTAYEEVDDGGNTSLSANFVGSWADNNSLIYASPALDMGGVSATIHLEYSPEATGTSPNDGTVVDSITYGNGKSLGVTLAGSGVTFGAYGATRENNVETPGVNDSLELVSYLNYAVGNVALGVSMSHYDAGNQPAAGAVAELATAAKVVGTAGGIFESTTYSIAYNINENVSVSYAKATDTYDAQASNNANNGAVSVADVDADSESFQVAYSMGAMSIKAYQTKSDNNTYLSGTSATSQTTSEIALGLAF
jgi:outer membrane protein OmpU